MGEWILIRTSSFDQASPGSGFDFLGKYWETYNYALELISLAIIDVIKLIMTRYKWIGGGI